MKADGLGQGRDCRGNQDGKRGKMTRRGRKRKLEKNEGKDASAMIKQSGGTTTVDGNEENRRRTLGAFVNEICERRVGKSKSAKEQQR